MTLHHNPRPEVRPLSTLLALLGLLAGPVAVQAQDMDGGQGWSGWSRGGGGAVLLRDSNMEREAVAHAPLVASGERYVIVHLAENRVFVFEGERAVWSAPAGTGTGFRLDAGGEHRWKFSTPRGLMRVRRMEKDPLWEAPDWHFIERGVPVPPPNHPSRVMRGVMGTTAIYLGDGIAIHGTNQPELLLDVDPDRRRVSHGCIRLTNEHARELLHMVEVGTSVLIF
ncbi:MAG: L,D-transpeptidase [Gemmatimonadetes bacterium]|nr:L,D-transpeptidase [Gemmatimonadota bacterium]